MSLADKLAAQINKDGPLSLDEYMAACLYDKDFGYYTKSAAPGQKDFTTAPEISPLFGELIGLYFLWVWQSFFQSKPQAGDNGFCLLEAGPGRGSLCLDILHSLRMAPELYKNINLALIEISPELRRQQQKLLAGFAPKFGMKENQFHWYDSLDDFIAAENSQPCFFIANEFFDAFPAKIWRREAGQDWAEVKVALANEKAADARRFCFQPDLQEAVGLSWRQSQPAIDDFARKLAAHIAARGGAGLIIDYGYEAADGQSQHQSQHHSSGSLQALYQGKPCHPLSNQGQADLTVHVDFTALTTALADGAPSLYISKLKSQGAFLLSLGLEARLNQLATAAQQAGRADKAAQLRVGASRLYAPSQMGQLFKVLEFSSVNLGDIK